MPAHKMRRKQKDDVRAERKRRKEAELEKLAAMKGRLVENARKLAAMLSTGKCTDDTTRNASSLLTADERAAVRWCFDKFASGQATLSLNRTLQLTNFLRRARRDGTRVARLVPRLFASCDAARDGRLGLTKVTWILLASSPDLVPQAWRIRYAETLHASMWERVRQGQRSPKACRVRAAEQGGLERIATIEATRNTLWRYYTAFPCSSKCVGRNCLRSAPLTRQVCLTMKSGVKTRSLLGLRMLDGRASMPGGASYILGDPAPGHPFDWAEGMFVHNMAILQTSVANDEFVMIGGMQGFVTNRTCANTTTRYNKRRWCLEPDVRRDGEVSASAPARGSRAVLSGVRLTRGRGWRWRRDAWSEPHVVLRGNDPPDCVDRRPEFTGYHPEKPRSAAACEFDGRLSAVRLRDGSFRLYARANRAYGAIAGGRHVQTTSSPDLERGWVPWRPIEFHRNSVDANSVDIYFFAVQTNPVNDSMLLALLPLSEPPWACIAISFSLDGVTFSTPINLLDSSVSFRQHAAHSILDHFGAAVFYGTGWSSLGFAARGEDHPVAGMVADPLANGTEGSRFLVYIHHAVQGISYRQDAARVDAYALSGSVLRAWTMQAARELAE